jgi:hypothetical protein
VKAAQISLNYVPDSQLHLLTAIIQWMWKEEQLQRNVGIEEKDEERVISAEWGLAFLQAEEDAIKSRTANKRQVKDWARYAHIWSETREQCITWWEINHQVKCESLFQFRMQCRELNQSMMGLLKKP